MEILSILNVILIILIAVGLFFAKSIIEKYIPTYIEEKAKNLATKEDVQEITRKTEEVQKEFKENFELFTSDVHFKYDYTYKQYSELYCKLYGIIIQSEYIRYFLKIDSNQNVSFDEAPFLEVTKTKVTNMRYNLGIGEPSETVTVKEFDTPISKFNKKMLYECIIENSQYATQKLLKLAISYRFSNTYYTGNDSGNTYSNTPTANIEEVRLIKELVCCIVSEYNEFRKQLKMDYNKDELETGIPQL